MLKAMGKMGIGTLSRILGGKANYPSYTTRGIGEHRVNVSASAGFEGARPEGDGDGDGVSVQLV